MWRHVIAGRAARPAADRARAWGSGARDRLRSERGLALPLAIAVVLVLTIAVSAVIEFSSANTRDSSLDKTTQIAKALAEDGLNTAAAVLAVDPEQPSPVSGTQTVPDGAVDWNASYNSTTERWTVTSTASLGNPTGPGTSPATRTVQAEFEEAPDTTPWNFVYVKPTPGDCLTFSNTFVMQSPLYVDGNFCLQNSAQYGGPRLYVKGTLTTANTSSVGTAAARVPRVSVADNSPSPSGCGYTTSLSTPPTFELPCGDAQQVYASAFDTVVPPIDKPVIDFPVEYGVTQPGSTTRNHRCYANSRRDLQDVNTLIGNNWSTARAAGGWAGASAWLDNDTTKNASLGTFNLMPRDVSYACETRNVDGTLLARIAWTYGEPGTLEISGPVYLDGNVRIAQTDGVVNGSGWVYASGTITLEQHVSLCGVPDCGLSWDPNMEPPHLIFLAAGHTGTGTNNWSVEVQNSAKFQGGLFANGGMFIGQSAMVHGPAIADQLAANNTSDFNPWPWLAGLPDGAPTNTVFTFRMRLGSWRG
jgi:hypothetical protein